MNPDHTETETSVVISGYFDGALSAAESSDLAVRLRTDPAAALEFAHMARVHALLEAAAPPRAAGRAVVLRRRWLSIGAAAALIAAGSFATLQYFSKSPVDSGPPNIVIDGTGDFHRDHKPLPTGVNLRTLRPAPAGTPVSLDHLLENYCIHADPNGLTVPEALLALERAIAETNLLGRKELATLKFTAGPAAMSPERSAAKQELDQLSAKMKELTDRWEAAMRIVQDRLVHEELKQLKQQEGLKLAVEIKALERKMDDFRRRWAETEQQNLRISAPLPGPYTIKEYLDICSLYCEVRQQPGGVIYTAPAVSPSAVGILEPDDGQQERTFPLPPGLFRTWFPGEGAYLKSMDLRKASALKPVIGIKETLVAAKTAAKNAPESPAPAPPGPSLLRGTSIIFSQKDSTVTVKGSQEELDRWAQVVYICSQRKTLQHFLTAKFVVCPPALLPPGFDPATGMIMTDEQFQVLMRKLSQGKGVQLMTAPSVIVRPGQRSTIEVTSEVPLSQPVTPALTSDWLGLKQDILTTSIGETIQVSGMVDLGLPAASGVQVLGLAGSPDSLTKYTGEGAKHHRTGFDLWIPNRCTAMFTLDVNTGDTRTVLACITAQAIDPAGQPTGP